MSMFIWPISIGLPLTCLIVVWLALIKDPGLDPKQWVFPKVMRIEYLIFNILGLLVAIALFILARANLSGSYFVMSMIGLLIYCLLVFLFSRIVYEKNLLLFRLFESNCNLWDVQIKANYRILQALDELNKTVKANHGMQTQGLQYMCDRLAQLCDNTAKPEDVG